MFVLQMHISSGSWEADLVSQHYNGKNAGQEKPIFQAAGFTDKVLRVVEIVADWTRCKNCTTPCKIMIGRCDMKVPVHINRILYLY